MAAFSIISYGILQDYRSGLGRVQVPINVGFGPNGKVGLRKWCRGTVTVACGVLLSSILFPAFEHPHETTKSLQLEIVTGLSPICGHYSTLSQASSGSPEGCRTLKLVPGGSIEVDEF